MPVRLIFSVLSVLLLFHMRLIAQPADTLFPFSAIVYDEDFVPVPATHVINLNTHSGDVTDSLGIFRMPVHLYDTLLIRNIVFWDTLITVHAISDNRYVVLRKRSYLLEGARIFEWGATYSDFREAFIEMPVQQTLGADLGLPRQDPDKVPVEMDERAVRSAGLLFTSPISFFYYNFNKHAKSARKVYWMEKNQEKKELFESLVSADNISEITGLSGEDLEEFQLFLSQRMLCDLNCTELDVYKEIYGLWDMYQELKESGIIINLRK
jgi:hypothetical protein